MYYYTRNLSRYSKSSKIITPIPIQGVSNPIITPIFSHNIIEINKFVDKRYADEIYPLGKTIVTNELSNISQLHDDNAKLDEIFRWEMQDWHNPGWEPIFYTNNENPYWLNNASFVYSDLKLLPKREFQFTFFTPKNPNGTYYGDDPYWLAYNKMGACRELSTLFSYMANNAGIESRTVTAGNWHQWVEVNISGEWMYYDPWCAGEHHYYNSTDGNLTFKSKWFNKIEYFEENCQSGAYLNFYNEAVPNPLATPTYLISYMKNSLNIS